MRCSSSARLYYPSAERVRHWKIEEMITVSTYKINMGKRNLCAVRDRVIKTVIYACYAIAHGKSIFLVTPVAWRGVLLGSEALVLAASAMVKNSLISYAGGTISSAASVAVGNDRPDFFPTRSDSRSSSSPFVQTDAVISLLFFPKKTGAK
jgi:hypothetical protein